MQVVPLDLGSYAPYQPSPGVGRWRYERPLPLTTPGHLRVAAIGVGSAFSDRYDQSNFILIKGDTAVFVDLGTQGSLRLVELGLTCFDVRNLIVTHSHADHIGSLEELALKLRYEAPTRLLPRIPGEGEADWAARQEQARITGQFRPRLFIPDFYARLLWEMSLRGGLGFSEEPAVRSPEGGMNLEHFFDPVYLHSHLVGDIPTWSVKIGDIHITTFLTKHVPEAAVTPWRGMYSIGLTVDDRLFISGDTQYDPSIIETFGKTCEVLWHDCQHYTGGVHASFDELKQLPPDVRKRMHLYHLSDGMAKLDPKAAGFADFLRAAPTVYDFK